MIGAWHFVVYKMSISIHEIIGEIKHNIGMRLDILESLLRRAEKVPTMSSDTESISQKFHNLEQKVDKLYELVKHNEKQFTVDMDLMETPTLHIDEECEEECEPVKIYVSHEEDSTVPVVHSNLVNRALEEEVEEEVEEEAVEEAVEEEVVEEEVEEAVEEAVEEEAVEEEVVEEAVEEEEVVEEEAVEEEEEEVEEEVVEEDEVEEQEEEDGTVELTEFSYKGLTLYRDSEDYVYQTDSEGALIDTPIGIWDNEKQRIKKIT